KVKKDAVQWEKDRARHPVVLAALARKYEELKQAADQERCLQAYIRRSPDWWAYMDLAHLYRSQKRMDRWLATMQAYLKEEDVLGLSHAQVHVELAQHFMFNKELAEAKPHAEAA